MSFDSVISGIVTGFSNISSFVSGGIESIKHFFDGLDFTILYNWLPSDIVYVITACIAFLLVLALFGILRRILFFLG